MNANPGKSTIVYVSIALLVGVVGGSWNSVSDWLRSGDDAMEQQPTASDRPDTANQPGASRASAGTAAGSGSGGAIRRPSPGAAEEDSAVFANAGLRLTPARRGSEFLGYRVLEASSDQRFKNGDIIATINGDPVEDSAAGSELLIAALANDETRIGLRRGDD